MLWPKSELHRHAVLQVTIDDLQEFRYVLYASLMFDNYERETLLETTESTHKATIPSGNGPPLSSIPCAAKTCRLKVKPFEEEARH